MKKFYLFDYEPSTIYGDDLEDAIIRQKTFHTPSRHRRTRDTQNDFETYGGEACTVEHIVQLEPSGPHKTRGNKQFITAVVELDNRKVIGIDAHT